MKPASTAPNGLSTGFLSSILVSLRNPVQQLLAFQSSKPRWNRLPFRTWGILTSIAVGGSIFYGASLTQVVHSWQLWQGALILTASAGLAWCFFGPSLVLVTRRDAFICAHACLV